MKRIALILITALLAFSAVSCDGLGISFLSGSITTPDPEEEDEDENPTQDPSGQPVTPDPNTFWKPVQINTDGLVHASYTEDTDNFANPERGFYKHCAFSSASDSYSVSKLQGYRTGSDQCSVVLFIFWIGDFVNKDISQNYLNCIKTAFSNARKAGVKAVVRFGYFNGDFDTENPQNNPTPWDATKEKTLRHIEQLKPILKDNSDVIICLQAGFCGWWGEWYYTDHFGYQPESDLDYEPRRELIEALLDAMPENRQVAVRTPTFKLKMLRLGSTDTLNCATAYQNTPKARICGHNDCFVAASDDWGTFEDESERSFWCDDSKYTFMGGETCAVSDYSGCSNTVDQMERQHYSYLNSGYNEKVISSWNKGGCLNDVKKRLGYRLVLRDSWISPDIKAGENVRLVLSISNVGFAAPINPRGLEIVLKNESSGKTTVTPIASENPRFWLAGKTRKFEVSFKAPSEGSYSLYLNLPDPESSLHDNPLYSIRLANKNTWDAETGYNFITTVKVSK
ncbi:MAG: DUF4832 domain-containing protein [Bacteroidales bacterium]|nr:DUF4832 domain-containing protein [Bacteroidales bacterium]